MTDAIRAVGLAFGRDAEAPQRQLLGASLMMPARVGGYVGIKVVSIVPGNPVGMVAVFGSDGSPIGIVDGPTLTAIRTGAVAGLATDLLAPASASTFAMLGTGALARDQIAAVRQVRNLVRINVWSRDRENADALAAEVGGTSTSTPEEAVEGVDIVTTATPATEPLFNADALGPEVHVNAMGAFTPAMVEIPGEFVRDAYVVVENRTAAAKEAGDLIQAGREPDIDLTELLANPQTRSHHRTLFKSVGIATMDVAAAFAALENASRLGVGVVV